MFSFEFGLGITLAVGTIHNIEASYKDNGDLNLKFNVRVPVNEYNSETRESKNESAFHRIWETGPENYKKANGENGLTELGKILKFVKEKHIVAVLYKQSTSGGEPKIWADKDGYAHSSFGGRLLLFADVTPKAYSDWLETQVGQEGQTTGAKPRPKMQAPAQQRPASEPAPAGESAPANGGQVGSAWSDDD